MRVTKTELLKSIEDAQWFMRLPMRVVYPSGEEAMRDKRLFIAVERYANPLRIIQAGEIGTDGQVRYKRPTRKTDRR